MADVPQLLLDHHLKTLKLPTFLREYAKQARLSADDGVDHIAYLARLAELELIDRERRQAGVSTRGAARRKGKCGPRSARP